MTFGGGGGGASSAASSFAGLPPRLRMVFASLSLSPSAPDPTRREKKKHRVTAGRNETVSERSIKVGENKNGSERVRERERGREA
eukprot:6174693-Pleurochrysis_carterae.AAC.4